MKERDFKIALSLVDGVGAVTYRKISEQLEREGIAVSDLFGEGAGRLSLPERVASAIYSFGRNLDAFQRTLDRFDEMGINAVIIGEEEYPERLIESLGKKSPPVLFYYGNVSLFQGLSGGVVGTRQPDETGVECARRTASALVKNGHTVVSGCAKGVDTIAQAEALDRGGNTVGVLPQGMLTLSSSTFRELDSSSCLLISEFPPSQIWTAGCAMARNKTICALSDLIVVIQASSKGGSLNSGMAALEMGKRVFVIDPLDRENPDWGGNVELIRKGGEPLSIDPDTGDVDFEKLFEQGPKPKRKLEASQGNLF